MKSDPPLEPRDGPAIIVGGGPTALDDLAHWRYSEDLFCEIIVINSMGEKIKADHLISAHAAFLGRMREHTIGSPKFHTIALGSGMREEDIEADYLWTGIPTGGTSGLLAVKIVRTMGFSPVYLAGIPMSVDGYVPDYRKYEGHGGRVFKLGHNPQILQDWRAHWGYAKVDGWLDGVISRAGWTKELLENG